MKPIKKKKTFSKDYYPVVVCMDDLQELHDILQSKGGTVDISTDEYKFDSIEDAAEYFGERPQFDLQLSSNKLYADVHFTRLWTKVYVSSGDDAAAIFIDIDDLLVKRQRKLQFLYSQWILVPVIFLGSISSLWSDIVYPWVDIAYFVGIFWIFWALFINIRRHSIIRFQRLSEAKTFWERNRDQVFLIVISAIIGGLITWGGTKLQKYFFSPDVSIQSQKNTDTTD